MTIFTVAFQALDATPHTVAAMQRWLMNCQISLTIDVYPHLRAWDGVGENAVKRVFRQVCMKYCRTLYESS
jgi:hypothetical protein